MQGLILLHGQVHASCPEGQKWKEQVPSPGAHWHLSLTAPWAPSRHQVHRGFICWQLLLLWLFWCAGNSLCFGKHYSCMTCKLWVMVSLGVSTVTFFLPVRPVLPGGEVLDLGAAASLVPWRGIAGKRPSLGIGCFTRVSLGNKFETPVSNAEGNTGLMATW